ncbi:lipid-A-disaccharide synthase [Wenzhouxiangella sp. AB-CW3]|uniref:lipid-A-disaccharide synthase n=1 Tax=Wenzhouxiangella sp. AB-CW3 TaxID=2771012 RepID=UPI00168ADBC9|nr:lipid-A-disaccharide synthase [Wenzhouxiangella sp. AB-CW3]QOC22994.1 lipid-A-disaccharide synthase [Wenzhouxiangella sp. AB-CW3]
MAERPIRLVLTAGESSGDQLGADLADHLRRQHPGIELAGIAGPAMQAAGVEPWHDLDVLGVMGLTEVLSHLPRLIRLRRKLRQRILDWQPDAFVGVDAPDFNLGLARQLRKRGLKTVHYVSPTVWAWRAGRTRVVARSVDLLLALFPFEPELYAPHGLDTRFVGHPVADQLSDRPGREAARSQLGLAPDDTVVALLPGSRRSEIERHARLLSDTAAWIRARRESARIIVFLADRRQEALFRDQAGNDLDRNGIEIIAERTRTGLIAADAACVASGTATLETFLLECPAVAYYRLAPATYWMIRGLRLIRSRHIAMPNILFGDEIVPEFVQAGASPEALGKAVIDWLDQPQRRAGYRDIARGFRHQLAAGAGQNAARAVLELVGAGRGQLG